MYSAIKLTYFGWASRKGDLRAMSRGGLLLCALLWASFLGAQPTSFTYFSKKDGLSQSSVFAIAQDDSGFLWFGTRDGLNRYDGNQFKVYKNDTSSNSLVANDVRVLYADRAHDELWIGTTAGLSRYRPISDDFENYLHLAEKETSLSQNVIRVVFRDSKDRLWVGTSNGVNLFHESSKSFSSFFFDKTFGSGSRDVKSILEDHDGNIWFGTADGLFRLEVGDLDFYFERMDGADWQLSGTDIRTMIEDKSGNLWIGTNGAGLNCWHPQKKRLVIFKNDKNDANSLSHNNIRALRLDSLGGIWIGTFDGLNYLNRDHVFTKFGKSKTDDSGLSDKSIHSLLIDRQGSLWVGTYYGGINQLNQKNNRFTNFHRTQSENSLSADIVSSFAEDTVGNLWIGTEGGGLNYYNLSTGQFVGYQYQANNPTSLSGNNIKQIILDSNYLWVGTFQSGLNLFDIKNETFLHFVNNPTDKNTLSNNNVYNLRKRNKLLWILTYGGGVDVLDTEKMNFRHFKSHVGDPGSLSSNLTRVILETDSQEIWIGTEKGLNKVFLDELGYPKRMETLLPNEKIYSLQEDRNHQIWIGTFSHGLYHLDPISGSLNHFSAADGLPGNTIFGILQADENELWLSTNNGLSKFDLAHNKFTNYNYISGLQNVEYNFNAYYRTRSGGLLFGGINGFTLFDPREIQQDGYLPPIVFTELRQNNKPVAVGQAGIALERNINQTEKLIFKYNEANFSIHFAALDFTSPQNNQYAYMLEGFDKNWTYTIGETQATYTIQRDGDYLFRLKAANSDGVWNPKERQILISVMPPFYRTGWAYLIYLLTAGGLIYGLVRYIRLRHKLQLELIAKGQQKELHESKLRFFTNITHEFRTPLTLILGPVNDLLAKDNFSNTTQGQLTLVQRNAQRLLRLVNQILSFRKLDSDHEPLRIVHENIVVFAQEIFLLFKENASLRNIEYDFECANSEILAWFDPDKLERVFFNLLSNAFKFTPDGGKIKMVVSTSETDIEIQLADSGTGVDPAIKEFIFKRFFEKSDKQLGTGIGLAIAMKMMELHHGKIFVQTNQSDVDKGAVFVVQIPKGKSHFGQDVIIGEPYERSRSADFSIIKHLQPTILTTDMAPIALSSDSPKLLIVEDNPEVKAYIQQIFASDYHILLAENGVEALRKAKDLGPDIIISDVMMPQMDGISFCQKLKSDIEISHIPIVLLTARTADIFKIEGLQTGADDYLTKPFNPEELRLRIRNILHARHDMRVRFAQASYLEDAMSNVSSADDRFLQRAFEVVKAHIGDEQFKVLQFASEMAVSRALLFTKLKALTGQTPNKFVKTMRMKYAAELLQTNKLQVGEVADKVGFKDPKYFRKCFQDQFGVVPSKYSEQ